MIAVDVVGDSAIKLLELEYMRERCEVEPDEQRLQDLREAISLARGWGER